jgi:hypothetical protein
VSSRSSDALKLKDTPRREDHNVTTPMSASPTAASAHQYRVAPDPVTPSPVSASPVAQRPVTGVNYNQTDEATAVFDDIAKNNKWGHKESISGDGSSLDNTVGLRDCAHASQIGSSTLTLPTSSMCRVAMAIGKD